MDEKTQARIKKLQALAERGVGGEKETATRKLQELLYGKYGKRQRRRS
jgi:hypothetical protein